MQPAEYDIEHRQGQTFDRTYNITIGGSNWNLTGYTANMHIRSTASSTTLVASFSTSDGSIVVGNGTLRLVRSASYWSAIAPKTYVHDIELVAPNGTVSTVWFGKFVLNAEVTRA